MTEQTTSSLPMLSALRKAVELVLKIDSRTIVLTPNPREKKLTGGLYETEPGESRDPQKFTITVTSDQPANNDGAQAHPYRYELVGLWDAKIEVGDTWEDGESKYRVIEVKPKNDYETRAVAVGFGPDLNYGS